MDNKYLPIDTAAPNSDLASHTKQPWFTNERLNLLLAICAIVISAASFYATYIQASAAERQVKAATWPWLEVSTGNFNDEEKREEISFELKNSGAGPALIKYVRFNYQDQTYSDINQLLDACCFDTHTYYQQLKELQEKSPNIDFFKEFGWIMTSSTHNRLLASGENISMLTFSKTPHNKVLWEKLNTARFKTNTELCYCSVLEQCYLSDGRGEVKEVERCAIIKKDNPKPDIINKQTTATPKEADDPTKSSN